MRLVILSRRHSLHSTRRFVETARVLEHEALVLDPLNFLLTAGEDQGLIHHAKRLSGVSLVIPRIGSSITDYGLAVVRQFEHTGVFCLNPSLAINVSRDKWRTTQVLAAKGLPVPKSALVRTRDDVARAVAYLGGLPVVVKRVQGTQGIGVFLAENLMSLETVLETLWELDQLVFLQEYVAESAGSDLRVLVMGDRVVGAMRRQARQGEFRANLHRGGEGRPVDLPDTYKDAAIQALQATGLRVGGVDLLESSRGPLILEVNSSPGFEGLERATGEDIAGLILEYAFSEAASAIDE